MSSDPGAGPAGAGGAPPTEEELRAAYEAELSRVDVTDMVAQMAVSLLNVAAVRMRPEPGPAGAPAEPEMEQARDAIDGARALVAILERRIPGELGPIRQALSQLQMAYAAQAGAAGSAPQDVPAQGAPAGAPAPGQGAPAGGAGGAAGSPAEGSQQPPKPEGPGPAESSGRLWVPGR